LAFDEIDVKVGSVLGLPAGMVVYTRKRHEIKLQCEYLVVIWERKRRGILVNNSGL